MYSYRTKLARLLVAMSLDQAKGALGFRSNENPSPDEVNKAWRSLAFKNHPDRGGDPQKMVELNVAKDVLTGKLKGDRYTPSPGPSRQQRPTYWTDKDRVHKDEEPSVKIPGKPFSHLKIPAGVNWLAVSLRGTTWEYKSPGDYIILIGRDSSERVVVSGFTWYGTRLIRDTREGPLMEFEPTWNASSRILEKNVPVKKILTTISAIWEEITVGGTKPNKGHLWAAGQPTEDNLKKYSQSGGTSLNALLVEAGFGKGSPAKGKVNVELVLTKKTNPTKSTDSFEPYQSYDKSVRLNGREVRLSDKTGENLYKHGLTLALNSKNDGAREIVFNLSRLRGGALGVTAKVALQILLKSLTSEPPGLRLALESIIKSMS
jgi:hypothetical protein